MADWRGLLVDEESEETVASGGGSAAQSVRDCTAMVAMRAIQKRFGAILILLISVSWWSCAVFSPLVVGGVDVLINGAVHFLSNEALVVEIGQAGEVIAQRREKTIVFDEVEEEITGTGGAVGVEVVANAGQVLKN